MRNREFDQFFTMPMAKVVVCAIKKRLMMQQDLHQAISSQSSITRLLMHV